MTGTQRSPGVHVSPGRWRALSVLSLVRFLIVADNTVVNVALPSVQHGLHLSASALVWVVNGYMLTAGGLLLLGGRMADLYGRRRMFLAGTVLFAAASLAGGLAPNGGALIAARFVQGAGEALAAPAALSLLAVLFPIPKERSTALGVWGGLGGLGAVLGVVVSGVLVQLVSWRWVFLINLPFAVVALLLLPRLVGKDDRTAERPPLDIMGAALATAGLVAVVEGLLEAGQHGWSSGQAFVPLVGGLALLAVFLGVEARSSAPLTPLSFFAERTRTSANAATLVLFSAFSSTFLLLTLYLQDVLHYSPITTGAVYLPLCLAMLVGFGLSTLAMPRYGIRNSVLTGFALAAVAMLLLTRISTASAFGSRLLPALLLFGIGLGLALPGLQVAGLHGAGKDDAGLASGVQNTVQAIAGALGNAVMLSLALHVIAERTAAGASAGAAATAGYRLAFGVAAAALVGGAVLVGALIRRVIATPDGESASDLKSHDSRQHATHDATR